MPLQLYDKEKIMDACFKVFAHNGYANTSTTMLAEAAGTVSPTGSEVMVYTLGKSGLKNTFNI